MLVEGNYEVFVEVIDVVGNIIIVVDNSGNIDIIVLVFFLDL